MLGWDETRFRHQIAQFKGHVFENLLSAPLPPRSLLGDSCTSQKKYEKNYFLKIGNDLKIKYIFLHAFLLLFNFLRIRKSDFLCLCKIFFFLYYSVSSDKGWNLFLLDNHSFPHLQESNPSRNCVNLLLFRW